MNEPSTLDIVNKLPITLYFASIPDRQQVLKYINYLYINVPASKDVLPDKLFREVIAKHLRIVNMKIIEPEILLVIALDKITLTDFSLPSDELIKNVISENQEKYEFDILYRVLSQIMNKIPRDLKERITGKQKLQIFHLVSKFIKLDKSILEKFIAFDPSLNTPISMELNENDYKTLNEKYLRELHKFQQKHSYLNSNSLEYGALASELYQKAELDAKLNGNSNDNYNDNDDDDTDSGNTGNGNTGNGNFKSTNIKAQYIDKNPDLMLGTKDNILYYYDSGSGTISEMPLNSTQVPVSISDLKTILTTNKIKQGDIANTINLLTEKTIPNISTSTTLQAKPWSGRFVNSVGSIYTSISNTILPKPKPTPTPTPTGDSSSNDKSINNNINNKSPIPPEFLKKLYNNENQYNNNSSSSSGSSGGGSSGDNGNAYGSGSFGGGSGGSFGGGSGSGSFDGGGSGSSNPKYANGKYMSNNAVNLDIKFNLLKQSYNKDDDKTPDTISHFSNINDNDKNNDNNKEKTNNTISHNNVVDKIKNNNKKIENIAIGFITSIILIFLLVIYNNIRHNKK